MAPEQQAIIQLRQGNIDGLEFLVRQYQTQALRVAYLITFDQALAEDVVQSPLYESMSVSIALTRADLLRPGLCELLLMMQLKHARNECGASCWGQKFLTNEGMSNSYLTMYHYQRL